MQKATNYSMDLNAIGVSTISPELKLDMYCHQVGGTAGRNNWSTEQCILRVRLNNPCVIKCAYGRKLKAQMDASGEDYKLEPFTGIVVGEKTKERLKKVENPNDKWPGQKKERNMKIAIELVKGATVRSLADKYAVSKTNIRKVSYRYYMVANARVFSACPEHMSKTEFAQLNKKLILPFLVFHKEAAPILKGD